MECADACMEMERWHSNLYKTITVLESINENMAGLGDLHLRFDKILENIERLDREATIETKVLRECELSTNSNCKTPHLFKQRIGELASETEQNISSAAKRIQQLKKSAQNEGNISIGCEVEMVFYSRKDPYTKRDIKIPVQNKICKHVYDRESVQANIRECRKRRQLCQCPVSACPNRKSLKMSDMKPFPNFFDFVKD